MTTFKVTVEDEQAEELKKLLLDVSFVKSITEEQISPVPLSGKPESGYDRIKKLLDSAKGKNLFAEIEDPSDWQRQIRKEWDRDF